MSSDIFRVFQRLLTHPFQCCSTERLLFFPPSLYLMPHTTSLIRFLRNGPVKGIVYAICKTLWHILKDKSLFGMKRREKNIVCWIILLDGVNRFFLTVLNGSFIGNLFLMAKAEMCLCKYKC